MRLSSESATRVNEKLPEVRTDAGYGEFFVKKRGCTKLARAPVFYDQIHGKKHNEE